MKTRMPHDPALMDKEARAVDLRASGHSYDEIAEALGYRTRSAAYKAVTRALERRPAQSVDNMRAQMGAQLDMLDRAVFRIISNAESSDIVLKAVVAAVRVAERRARLFGMDMPSAQTDAEGPSVTVV